MKISVFSNAKHLIKKNSIYSYGPYVKEMNYWFSEFQNVSIIAPISYEVPGNIDTPFSHSGISIIPVPDLHYKGNSFIQSLLKTVKTLIVCFSEMQKSDHIHLRCPGNTAMLAMIVSSFFPKKLKTIKYAGNWDPKSKQPLSYRFQKWWLSNSYLTRNAKVLVYGKWESQSRNILSFFTASFSEKEGILTERNFQSPWHFLFCGKLSEGKRPLLALEIIHGLLKKGHSVKFDIYGDGPQKLKIREYIQKNNLEGEIALMGNRNQEELIKVYKSSHFCILPSKSEGWPKVLAEAMYFGCIPISTKISCVPWMLGDGKRGILIDASVNKAVDIVDGKIMDELSLMEMSKEAQNWSREYNLERFKKEIHKLL